MLSTHASKEELARYLATAQDSTTYDPTTLLIQHYTPTELPELPANLTSLRLYHCKSLTALPELPPSLNDLWIHNTPNLANLPNLPSTLTFLLFAEEKSIRNVECPTLPSFPEGLIDLRLAISGITELPAFPKSLKALRICLPGIKDLPMLPSTLEFLHLSGCSGLLGRKIQVGNLAMKFS